MRPNAVRTALARLGASLRRSFGAGPRAIARALGSPFLRPIASASKDRTAGSSPSPATGPSHAPCLPETTRYARHLVLRDIGGAGQQKLKAARVLVIGAGGLGSPVIAYLAAAGVGTHRHRR